MTFSGGADMNKLPEKMYINADDLQKSMEKWTSRRADEYRQQVALFEGMKNEIIRLRSTVAKQNKIINQLQKQNEELLQRYHKTSLKFNYGILTIF